MAEYLLHLRKDGYPVGIHAEDVSFYFPTDATHEVYGKSVVQARGSETTWDEWREQLSEQALSRRARWLPFSSPRTDMQNILLESQSGSDYAIE